MECSQNFYNCKLSTIKNKECVLHCDKENYYDDSSSHILNEFYNELIEYIIKTVISSSLSCRKLINLEDSLRDYFKFDNDNEMILSILKEQKIIFSGIKFPDRKEGDPVNYINILNKLKKIQFVDCKFKSNNLNLPNAELYFQTCYFLEDWSITKSTLIKDVNSVLYIDCTFNKDIRFCIGDEYKNIVDISLFSDCKFYGEILMENIIFKKAIFNNEQFIKLSLLKLIIKNCDIEDRFILNNLEANLVNIEKTVFHKKVELKNGNIGDLELIDTNFENIFDAFATEFDNFYCEKCIFKNFAAFEECTFSDNPENKPTEFNRSTFLDFVTFRGSEFVSGLDIDFINLRGESNFLNVNINEHKTTRQSYRIIKHSFDQAGDHIEANKYFAAEMRRYEEEISKKNGVIEENIIFKLNKWMSNFGQSYFQPLGWIIFFGIIYTWLSKLNSQGALVSGSCVIDTFIDFLNDFAKSIIPFQSLGTAKEGMEFLSLIFGIIFASLTWQLIVAVKRHTKR